MSTLPFLLSVADELDNVNSQSYMDDFGLGFHPHRQYYRTPSIQLSLPASTDWMQERQRCRTHKFVDESQNNLNDGDGDDDAADGDGDANDYDYDYDYDAEADNRRRGRDASEPSSSGRFASALNSNPNPSTSASTSATPIASTNTNPIFKKKPRASRGRSANANAARGEEDDDNIDNSVQLYRLSKKCCKNHHRVGDAERTASADGSFRLHAKCMESSHSSSEESLQKAPASSIEFLTCFLVKKSRAPKHAGGDKKPAS